MAAARPILGLLSLLVLAAGVLFQFFVILSGSTYGTPENQIYFLEASTNGIAGARNPARWTYFALCGVNDSGHNANCASPQAALPFDPPRNFGTDANVPGQFIGSRTYFYLSRFMFAFYLIALFFAVIALFTGLLALCSRLGGYFSGFTTSVACFFQTLTAALMTAWTVMGRNAFRSNGQDAKLGIKAYGFTWAAVACFFISMVLFCISGAAGKAHESRKSHRGTRARGGRGVFGRKRSTRSQHGSRGSFYDAESQRRVKDETY